MGLRTTSTYLEIRAFEKVLPGMGLVDKMQKQSRHASPQFRRAVFVRQQYRPKRVRLDQALQIQDT
jgi:hypothetical protein